MSESTTSQKVENVPIKALVLILLTGTVVKFGRPLRAAVVYAIIKGALALVSGQGIAAAGVVAAVAFTASAAVFWLIDWADGIFLAVVVTVLGVGALFAFK